MQHKLVDLAWAAGFFDGEGYVGFRRTKTTQGILAVDISQNIRAPLDKLTELFGGAVRGPYTPNGRNYYKWRTSGEIAKDFCNAIFPFCLVKQTQIINALEQYGEYRKNSKYKPRKSNSF